MSLSDATGCAAPSLFPPGCGPSLPEFLSLLVYGPYHASAPVNLCFSASDVEPGSPSSEAHNAPILLITACKDALKDSIRSGGWQRTGRAMKSAKRVQVLAPPTAVHAELLLSLLRVWTPGCDAGRPAVRKPKTSDAPASAEPQAAAAGALASDDSAATGARAPIPTSTTSNAMRANVLAQCPALIVLLEPSTYFVHDDDEEGQDSAPSLLSSYIALVSRLLRTSSALAGPGRPPIPVALFDSGIHTLRLPVTKALYQDGTEEYEEEDHNTRNTTVVSEFVRELFQWEAFFEEDDAVVPSSQDQELDEDHGVPRRLKMRTASGERKLAFRQRGKAFIWGA